MSSAKISEIDAALNRKGFIRAPHRNKHIFYYFHYDGKKTSINTHYSKGEYVIGDPLIRAMAKQMNLTKEQFLEYVECSISLNDYINLLKQQKII